MSQKQNKLYKVSPLSNRDSDGCAVQWSKGFVVASCEGEAAALVRAYTWYDAPGIRVEEVDMTVSACLITNSIETW